MALHKVALLVLFGAIAFAGCGDEPDIRFQDDPLGQYLIAKEVTPKQIAEAEAEIDSMNAFRLEFMPVKSGVSLPKIPSFHPDKDFHKRYTIRGSNMLWIGTYMHPSGDYTNLSGLPSEPIRDFVNTYEANGFQLSRIEISYDPTPEVVAHFVKLLLAAVERWQTNYDMMAYQHEVLSLAKFEKQNFEEGDWKQSSPFHHIGCSYGFGRYGVPVEDDYVGLRIEVTRIDPVTFSTHALTERRIRLPRQGHKITFSVEFGENGADDLVVASELFYWFFYAIEPLLEYERTLGGEPIIEDLYGNRFSEARIREEHLNANR